MVPITLTELTAFYAQEFTGVSSPYEEPEAPELVVESDLVSAEDAVEAILAELAARGITEK